MVEYITASGAMCAYQALEDISGDIDDDIQRELLIEEAPVFRDYRGLLAFNGESLAYLLGRVNPHEKNSFTEQVRKLNPPSEVVGEFDEND